MDESRSDSEKMDKKEKSDYYDSPSDLWSVFLLKEFEAAKKLHQRKQILLGVVERKLSIAQRSLRR